MVLEKQGREEKRVEIESGNSPILLTGVVTCWWLGGVCDQKTSKFFVSCRENPWQHMWCKWSLLKVREGKYKREHGGA
jgi:hypothetical protein